MTLPDRFKNHSVFDLFVLGSRMVDDFDEDAAVEHFLELHPEAKEADVRAELTRELEALAKRRSPQYKEWLRTGELPKREQEAE